MASLADEALRLTEKFDCEEDDGFTNALRRAVELSRIPHDRLIEAVRHAWRARGVPEIEHQPLPAVIVPPPDPLEKERAKIRAIVERGEPLRVIFDKRRGLWRPKFNQRPAFRRRVLREL